MPVTDEEKGFVFLSDSSKVLEPIGQVKVVNLPVSEKMLFAVYLIDKDRTTSETPKPSKAIKEVTKMASVVDLALSKKELG